MWLPAVTRSPVCPGELTRTKEVLLDFCHLPSQLACKAQPAALLPAAPPDAHCPCWPPRPLQLCWRLLPLLLPCSLQLCRMPAAPTGHPAPCSSAGGPLPLLAALLPAALPDARCPCRLPCSQQLHRTPAAPAGHPAPCSSAGGCCPCHRPTPRTHLSSCSQCCVLQQSDLRLLFPKAGVAWTWCMCRRQCCRVGQRPPGDSAGGGGIPGEAGGRP